MIKADNQQKKCYIACDEQAIKNGRCSCLNKSNFNNVRVGLSEKDLVELGFSKNLMVGTGWNSINSMCDAVYYYKKGRITINATSHWTWFLDNEQRNDIAVGSKEDLVKLINIYS